MLRMRESDFPQDLTRKFFVPNWDPSSLMMSCTNQRAASKTRAWLRNVPKCTGGARRWSEELCHFRTLLGTSFLKNQFFST